MSSYTITSIQRLAASLGGMDNPEFMRHCVNFRISRTHLLATGIHMDLSLLVGQAGFKIPVFIQRQAYERFTLQGDETPASDLWDVVIALRKAIEDSPLHPNRLAFQVAGITLLAGFGRVDYDDPRAAITVILPDEE